MPERDESGEPMRAVRLTFLRFDFDREVEFDLHESQRVVSVESHGLYRLVWIETEIER